MSRRERLERKLDRLGYRLDEIGGPYRWRLGARDGAPVPDRGFRTLADVAAFVARETRLP